MTEEEKEEEEEEEEEKEEAVGSLRTFFLCPHVIDGGTLSLSLPSVPFHLLSSFPSFHFTTITTTTPQSFLLLLLAFLFRLKREKMTGQT